MALLQGPSYRPPQVGTVRAGSALSLSHVALALSRIVRNEFVFFTENPGTWGSVLCLCGGGGQERSGELSVAEEPRQDE